MTYGPQLPHEAENFRDVSNRLGPSFQRLDRSIALGIDLIGRAGTALATPWRPRLTGAVVLGLYAKSIKTARAVRLAASAGLLEDGLVLCRTLLETHVAISYLVQRKGKRRAQEFVASQIAKIAKVADEWEKTPGLKLQGRRLKKAAQETLARDFTHIRPDRLKELRKGYAGMSIEAVFKLVGMNKDYQVVYRDLSSYPHAQDLQGHLDLTAAPGVGLLFGRVDAPDVRKVLDTARRILISTMYRVAQALDLGHLAEIHRLAVSPEDNLHELLTSWERRVRHA